MRGVGEETTARLIELLEEIMQEEDVQMYHTDWMTRAVKVLMDASDEAYEYDLWNDVQEAQEAYIEENIK